MNENFKRRFLLVGAVLLATTSKKMEKLQVLRSFMFLLIHGMKLCICAEETVLYDTSGSKELGQVGAKISLSSPMFFYDEKFQTVHVSCIFSNIIT